MSAARRAGELTRGLLAALLLLGLVIALPAALIIVGAPLLPHAVPTLAELGNTLGQRDDGSVFLALLLIAGFIGWAVFVVSVLLELAGRLRRRPVAGVPGLGWPRLLASMLLTTIAVAASGPGAAAIATPTAPLISMLDTTSTSTPAGDHNTGTASTVAPVRLAADIHTLTPTPQPTGDHTDGGHRASAVRQGQRHHLQRHLDPHLTHAHLARPHLVAGDTGGSDIHHVAAGESLWSIAGHRLGDPDRWTELWQLNQHRLQHDGQTLTDPATVLPGWVLRLPAHHSSTEHSGSDRYTVVPGDTLSQIAEDHHTSTSHLEHLNEGQPMGDGRTLADPNLIYPGWRLHLDDTDPANPPADPTDGQDVPTGPQDPTNSQTQAPETPQAQPQAPPSPGPSTPPDAAGPLDHAGAGTFTDPEPNHPAPPPPAPVQDPGIAPTAHHTDTSTHVRSAVLAAIGALAAAGLVGTFIARRFRATRRRRPGMRMLGTRQHGPAESALREQEDPDTVERLDTALRLLAQTCHQARLVPPALHGVTLTPAAITLHLADADQDSGQAIAPFLDDHHPGLWRLPAGAALPEPEDLDQVLAPYPGLVTIARDETDGLAMLDLETAGAITLTGEPERITAVLTALAVELAVADWADHLTVTLVGFGERLTNALPDRLAYSPDLDTALDEFIDRAHRAQQALTDSNAGSARDARTRTVADDAWIPEIILTTGLVNAQQQLRIRDIVTTEPRASLAAVIAAGDEDHHLPGRWHLDVPDDPHQPVRIPELGGQPLLLQHCDQLAYQAILDELTHAASTAQQPADGYQSVPPEPQLDDDDDDVDIDAAAGQGHDEYDLDQLARATDPDDPGIIWDSYETPTPDPEEHLDAGAEPLEHNDTATRHSTEPLPTAEAEADDELQPARNPIDPPTPDPAPVAATSINDDTASEDPATPAAGDAPLLRILGAVDILGPDPAAVADNKRARLIELAAYMLLKPERSGEQISHELGGRSPWAPATRQSAMSRLRTWLGSDTDGVAFVAPVSDTHGYRLAPAVRCDWHHFQRLARQGLQRGNDGITQLEQALALVRGRPFEAVPLGRYRWTDLLAYEMVDRISDVAHTAATHHLANGDLAAARAAIQRGRAADPTSELLLRDLARIEHQAGDRQALQAIHDHVQYIAEDLEVDPQPETTQLLTSLLSRDTETAIPRQYPRDQHAHA